jgi:cyclopropane fatty-acyl-phospholipid synthase-like methyltransferase
MITRPERFDIAGDLLAGPDGDGRWNNLGYWETAQNYTQACCALAERHGLVANLRPSNRVLELACGYGAAFDVWRDRFDVAQVSALEYRPDCVRHISSLRHPSVKSVLAGRFDEPLDELFPGLYFDAVLCVDAAYHATSLAAFVAAVKPVLAASGVLVFSTLVLAEPAKARFSAARWFAGALLNAAVIPKGSLMAESAVCETVAEQGLVVTTVEDISDAVFAGFADWVARRSGILPWRDKYSSWIKVEAVALWTRWLSRKPLSYVLITVTRATERV